jgi:RNA polymerase sigma-70 factor (ECF subfamily)
MGAEREARAMSETQTTVRVQNCLDRMGRGDATARGELIAVACDRLRLLARRMLRDYPRLRRWEETDDVLQNALVRLCRALEAVPIATAADFFRVAALQVRRELCDLARHYYGPEGSGGRHESGTGDPEGAAAEARDPADSTWNPARIAAWTRFHEKVEALPAEEKEIFDLLWYHELSAAEAAKMLGTSGSTVKRRWQAARRRLHDLLGGELPF